MEKTSESPVSPRKVLSRIRELRGLVDDADGADFDLTPPSLGELLGHTRRQLLECARCLRLTGIHRLTKAALASRVQHELAKLAMLAGPPDVADAPHKFDLGLAPAPGRPEHIPWGYGQDRVTAMAVDPDRLYVYWEVTDEALERGRAGLGPGGRDAWLNLRVYDVTNRIFDGTNAHHYVDHSVSRTDRQWFLSIGRPSSTVIVEIGLKSAEGYFVRIARSGRADFPRREPAPPRPVEWLTVHSASGEVGEPAVGDHGTSALAVNGAGPTGQPEPVRAWDIRRTHGEWVIRDESFGAMREGGEWRRERTIEWEGPLIRTTWQAGPFSRPVEPPRYVEERYEGTVTVRSVEGRSHIVYGPWRVVIRGLGARAERRILGVWEVHRSWSVAAGAAMRPAGEAARAMTPGGSEQVLLGASELRWLGASELRLGGASEIYLVGASELRYLGASETLYLGASEWRAMGASELRYLGASQWMERGASELRYAGASERLYPGASERAWAGASENRPRYPAEPSSSG
jgi:hypothetical protein